MQSGSCFPMGVSESNFLIDCIEVRSGAWQIRVLILFVQPRTSSNSDAIGKLLSDGSVGKQLPDRLHRSPKWCVADSSVDPVCSATHLFELRCNREVAFRRECRKATS